MTPRTAYIDGCMQNKVLPRVGLVVRKKLTKVIYNRILHYYIIYNYIYTHILYMLHCIYIDALSHISLSLSMYIHTFIHTIIPLYYICI